ncbi:aminoimidazole riboside kinase [Fodinisporobacter ferrooxydans]|uniref:Aminoimidazole riboside kinase n=1 Tax=Fodinisporobacter ferrooxydans TaxID=2901836 RepID=A0ABY4CPF9_9BACL|nr:aminoimidazole riboside kinase [Alicyclobacillaceae bacterium MYW30-H2]
MNGVISLGEALIDFIPLDSENSTYQKSPGGAPANVAVGIAKLGGKSTFLGKVGNDVLGVFLRDTLETHGVDVRQMPLAEEARTGLVFVTLDRSGERSFSFYIQPSADTFLNEQDVKESIFQEHKILHIGSISLIREPARSATKKAVRLAKQAGMLVSYDPNLRLSLWEDAATAKEGILSLLGEADVLKLSEEELEFLTGHKDLEAGLEALEHYGIPLRFVTMGGEGCMVSFKGKTTHVPAWKVEAIDTTGAGDAFVSGILYCLNQAERSLLALEHEDMVQMVRFAAVSGALAASTKGAMTALPTLEQVHAILQETV